MGYLAAVVSWKGVRGRIGKRQTGSRIGTGNRERKRSRVWLGRYPRESALYPKPLSTHNLQKTQSGKHTLALSSLGPVVHQHRTLMDIPNCFKGFPNASPFTALSLFHLMPSLLHLATTAIR